MQRRRPRVPTSPTVATAINNGQRCACIVTSGVVHVDAMPASSGPLAGCTEVACMHIANATVVLTRAINLQVSLLAVSTRCIPPHKP